MVCCGGKPAVKYDSTPRRAPVQEVKAPAVSAKEVKEVRVEAGEDSVTLGHELAAQAARLDEGLEGSEYALMCRQLLHMVSALRDAGASAMLDLPQVVVAGNQSAGKSSVIEALCGITLPRSDGTCTRCPIEVTMHEAEGQGAQASWSASVRIRREWDAYGSRLPTPELVMVKSDIRDPHHVEAAVRAAQEMLLTVDTPSEGGATQDSADSGSVGERVAFSRNTVVVEVLGAPVSLALVDLPGIIHATEHRTASSGLSADYPTLINELITDYCSRPCSVIVAVVSCKEDLDTQSILSLAREMDPEGHRTLGVLTKPDMIEEGCHGLWTAVMQGKRWPLKLGYYAVKNPSQVQLQTKISHGHARALEHNFFATSTWVHGGMGHGGHVMARLGTVRLRHALARLLADLTASAMPALLEDAQRQLAEVEKALSSIPPPLLPAAWTAPSRQPVDTEALLRRTMATLMDDVCSNVTSLMAPHGASPVATWNTLPGTPAPGQSTCGGPTPSPTSHTTAQLPPARVFWTSLMNVFQDFRAAVFTARPSYVVNGVCFSCASGDEEEEGGSAGVLGSGGASGDEAAGSMSLEEVWQLMESHRGMELPGFSPYGAVQALVSRSTAGWATAADRAVSVATARVRDAVLNVLQERLGRFPAALRVARGTAHTLVAEMSTEASEQVRTLITMECAAAFTMNRTEFESHSAATLQQLREAVAANPRRGMYANTTTPNPYTGASSDHVLSMIAVSLTYFTLAARRVVDYVPMHILYNLVNRCGSELKTVLAADLLAAQGGAAALSQLLAEDPSVVMQREELQHQRATLQAALRLLHAMGPRTS